MKGRLVKGVMLICCLLLISAPGPAEEYPEYQQVLTVYDQGFALVKDYSYLSLHEGINQIRLEDRVARVLDPGSVYLRLLDYPADYEVKEQVYQYGLADMKELLKRYLGKEIVVLTRDGAVHQGRLLGYDAQHLMISADAEGGGLRVIRRGENIVGIELPPLSRGMTLGPSLIFQIECPQAGRYRAEISYLTEGLGWQADYLAIVGEGGEDLDFIGQVRIDNRTGVEYRAARLRLVAGEVHRVREGPTPVYRKEVVGLGVKEGAPEERTLFEYHTYPLEGPFVLKDNQSKGVTLFSLKDIQASRLFLYDSRGWGPAGGPKGVKVKLQFFNRKETGLGFPLPRGKVRVYKREPDGSLEFIGEDVIGHTPVDREIRLYLGEAFDITAERKQMGSRRIGERMREETYQLVFENQKGEGVEIRVVEHLAGREWRIVSASHDYTKKDAFTIEFLVPVRGKGKTTLSYTVRYRW